MQSPAFKNLGYLIIPPHHNNLYETILPFRSMIWQELKNVRHSSLSLSQALFDRESISYQIKNDVQARRFLKEI